MQSATNDTKKLKVTTDEIDDADDIVAHKLKQAIAIEAKTISKRHKAQRISMQDADCSRLTVPYTKVGLFLPEENASQVSAVLMFAIPARLAGCRKVVLCTPPVKDGKIDPTILYAARVAGVTDIYKADATQAIAGMAFGTEAIPKMDKIFCFDTPTICEAIQQIGTQDVSIDILTGASEEINLESFFKID